MSTVQTPRCQMVIGSRGRICKRVASARLKDGRRICKACMAKVPVQSLQ